METETLNVTQARDAIAGAVDRVRYGLSRIIITKHAKPVAALISSEDLALFERLVEEAEERLDLEAAKEALADRTPTVSAAEVRKKLGLPARKRR